MKKIVKVIALLAVAAVMMGCKPATGDNGTTGGDNNGGTSGGTNTETTDKGSEPAAPAADDKKDDKKDETPVVDDKLSYTMDKSGIWGDTTTATQDGKVIVFDVKEDWQRVTLKFASPIDASKGVIVNAKYEGDGDTKDFKIIFVETYDKNENETNGTKWTISDKDADIKITPDLTWASWSEDDHIKAADMSKISEIRLDPQKVHGKYTINYIKLAE